MLTLCCSTDGRLIPAPNSPPVSMLGLPQQGRRACMVPLWIEKPVTPPPPGTGG
jgi:hypothetical protein